MFTDWVNVSTGRLTADYNDFFKEVIVGRKDGRFLLYAFLLDREYGRPRRTMITQGNRAEIRIHRRKR